MNTKVMTLIKRITLVVLGVALLVSAGLVFLTSYTSWKAYYEDMLIKKDRFYKEQEPEVTVMNGIRVSVKDGVGFFKNGKASADKGNFIVEGLYTIGNEINKRDYEEEIGVKDYELEAPTDFSENGGELTFRYLVTEEEKDEKGETVYVKGDKDKGDKVDKDGFKLDDKGNKIPETVTVYDFTKKLNIELLDVKLDHIEVTKNPYLVAYAEGDKFQSTGMTVNAVYNDGSKIENLAASLLDIKKDALTAEDKTVKLAYKYGEAEDEVIYGEVPVTVMAKNEFTNGELENLTVIGDVSLEVGKDVSSVKPVVYASYSSGNYIKLDESEYNISGLEGVAEFGKKYNLVITSAVQPEISTRLSLYPTKSLAAEQATLKGATAYDGYVKDFDSGDYIEFVYNSATATVVNFYLNMSNGYLVYENGAFVAKAINFNDFAYLSVNGKLKQVSYGFSSGGPYEYMSDGLMTYDKVYIGAYAVKAGDNIVRICFKDSSSGVTAAYGQYVAGAIENLQISSNSAPTAESVELGTYYSECIDSGITPMFSVTKDYGWGGLGTNQTFYNIVHSGATDGKYLFLNMNKITWGGNLTPCGKPGSTLVKYDIEQKTPVAYTDLFDFTGESISVTYIKGGFVYTVCHDGTFMRIPTSFTGKGTAKFEVVPNFAIKEAGVVVSEDVRSMYYSHALRKYAVLKSSNSFVLICDANGNSVKSFSIKRKFGGGDLNKITGDDKYIYASYKNDGLINPVMTIYDWSGNFVGEVVPQNSASLVNYENISKTNVQCIIQNESAMYFVMICWGGNGYFTSIFKASFGTSKVDSSDSMDLYEYIEACENKGVTPSYIKKPVLEIPSEKGRFYTHGMCTDNEYLYAASNVQGDKEKTFIDKYRISDWKKVGRTAYFNRGDEWNNGDYLTYIDGYVYVVLNTGEIKRVKADLITADESAVVEEYNLPVSDISQCKSMAYNALVNKIALLTENKLYIISAKAFNVEKSLAVSVNKPMGIGCDANYIYVLYEKNGSCTAKFDVYDWSGNLLKVGVEIPEIYSHDSHANNVQSMCVIGGEYYFLVSTWGNGGKLVKVSFDTSVLK